MKIPIRLHLCALTALLVALSSLGCSDSASTTEEINADCSICENQVPIGPSADVESCEQWGADFNCQTATLVNEGMCGDNPAICQVRLCEGDPVCVE